MKLCGYALKSDQIKSTGESSERSCSCSESCRGSAGVHDFVHCIDHFFLVFFQFSYNLWFYLQLWKAKANSSYRLPWTLGPKKRVHNLLYWGFKLTCWRKHDQWAEAEACLSEISAETRAGQDQKNTFQSTKRERISRQGVDPQKLWQLEAEETQRHEAKQMKAEKMSKSLPPWMQSRHLSLVPCQWRPTISQFKHLDLTFPKCAEISWCRGNVRTFF